MEPINPPYTSVYLYNIAVLVFLPNGTFLFSGSLLKMLILTEEAVSCSVAWLE